MVRDNIAAILLLVRVLWRVLELTVFHKNSSVEVVNELIVQGFFTKKGGRM